MASQQIPSNKKLKRKIKGFFAVHFVKLVAILPPFINRVLAYLIGMSSYLLSTKTQKTITRNLSVCFPALSEADVKLLAKKNHLETTKLALEFPTVWLNEQQKISRLLTEINGKQLVEEYVSKAQPIIIAVPHIGNWELFWAWLQMNYPIIGMYSPAKLPQMDQMIFHSRQRFGGEVFATDPKGILALMRRLKQSGIMMILTDQVPREGSGNYAPFFGHPAYTMTLLHRFMQKTEAKLFFGSCLRATDGNNFSINIYDADFNTQEKDAEVFNQGMNKQIESIIRLAPEQYQWGYKRFKRSHDGRDFYR